MLLMEKSCQKKKRNKKRIESKLDHIFRTINFQDVQMLKEQDKLYYGDVISKLYSMKNYKKNNFGSSLNKWIARQQKDIKKEPID